MKVRYLPDEPGVACIERATINRVFWVVPLLAIVSIGLGATWLFRGLRTRPGVGALLRKGIAVRAQVTAIEPLRLDGSGARMRITLQAPGGLTFQPTEVDRNHLATFARHHQSRQLVWVVYDPADPVMRFVLPEFL